jgi:hypothetical protein
MDTGRSCPPTRSVRTDHHTPSPGKLGRPSLFFFFPFFLSIFFSVLNLNSFKFEQFSNLKDFQIEQFSNLDKFGNWTILEFEQISKLNDFRIWTNFKIERFPNLNKFQILVFRICTIFEFKQFSTLNIFQKKSKFEQFSNLNIFSKFISLKFKQFKSAYFTKNIIFLKMFFNIQFFQI